MAVVAGAAPPARPICVVATSASRLRTDDALAPVLGLAWLLGQLGTGSIVAHRDRAPIDHPNRARREASATG
ncbi:MAG: hypothetical protein ACREOY_01485 [Candidatus Dormibacteraceae bacterium]